MSRTAVAMTALGSGLMLGVWASNTSEWIILAFWFAGLALVLASFMVARRRI